MRIARKFTKTDFAPPPYKNIVSVPGPPEWIFQIDWIKKAIIHLFCNPNIFDLYIQGRTQGGGQGGMPPPRTILGDVFIDIFEEKKHF